MLGSKDGMDHRIPSTNEQKYCLYISKIGQRNIATLTNIGTNYILFMAS